MQVLEDDAVNVSTMKSSKFYNSFKAKIDLWEGTLAAVSEVIDVILTIQRKWMYLGKSHTSRSVLQPHHVMPCRDMPCYAAPPTPPHADPPRHASVTPSALLQNSASPVTPSLPHSLPPSLPSSPSSPSLPSLTLLV